MFGRTRDIEQIFRDVDDERLKTMIDRYTALETELACKEEMERATRRLMIENCANVCKQLKEVCQTRRQSKEEVRNLKKFLKTMKEEAICAFQTHPSSIESSVTSHEEEKPQDLEDSYGLSGQISNQDRKVEKSHPAKKNYILRNIEMASRFNGLTPPEQKRLQELLMEPEGEEHLEVYLDTTMDPPTHTQCAFFPSREEFNHLERIDSSLMSMSESVVSPWASGDTGPFDRGDKILKQLKKERQYEMELRAIDDRLKKLREADTEEIKCISEEELRKLVQDCKSTDNMSDLFELHVDPEDGQDDRGRETQSHNDLNSADSDLTSLPDSKLRSISNELF